MIISILTLIKGHFVPTLAFSRKTKSWQYLDAPLDEAANTGRDINTKTPHNKIQGHARPSLNSSGHMLSVEAREKATANRPKPNGANRRIDRAGMRIVFSCT